MIVYTLNALRPCPVAVSSHHRSVASALAIARTTQLTTADNKFIPTLLYVFFGQKHLAQSAKPCQRLLNPLCNKYKALSTTVETILQKVQSPFNNC